MTATIGQSTKGPDSVSSNFAECELDDPKPFPTWEPSPKQIEEWKAIIRTENDERKRAERLERMNPAQQPEEEIVETGELEDIDYE